MWTLQPQTILLLLWVSARLKAEAGPKGSPWDWQRQYPVFQPYSKPEHELPHQPQFLPSPRNLTVTEGEEASLPCRVKNLFQHYTVSWIRASDVTVLSVGHFTFSSDERFSVLEIPRPRLVASDWSLTVKNASVDDSGMYECQVNTDPKMNRKFHLVVKGKPGNTQRDSPYYTCVADQVTQTVLFIVTPESSPPWASPLVSTNTSPSNSINFTFPLLIILVISLSTCGC